MTLEPKTFPDDWLAAGVASAPAWAPSLSELNQLLTTLSLIIGLVLGIGRLVLFLRSSRHNQREPQ